MLLQKCGLHENCMVYSKKKSKILLLFSTHCFLPIPQKSGPMHGSQWFILIKVNLRLCVLFKHIRQRPCSPLKTTEITPVLLMRRSSELSHFLCGWSLQDWLSDFLLWKQGCNVVLKGMFPCKFGWRLDLFQKKKLSK